MFWPFRRRTSFSTVDMAAEVPPPAPEGVWMLDGHWWRDDGIEDTPPAHRQYARAVWTCLKCHAVSKVFGNPPKVWAVKDLPTGKYVDSAPAHRSAHVAQRCPIP